MPGVSIVIPVFNGGADLRKCLDAIADSDYPVSECILVDDASTDGMTDQIAGLHGARVIHLQKQQGPAHARNRGVEEAVGELIFFVDADVLVHPDTLGIAVRALESDPETVAVFGSYDDEPGHRSFLSQYRNLFHHWVHQTGQNEASTFWTGCGVIRRETFLEMGGFKATYRRPSIEDIELGTRLRRSGYRIRLEKTMLCTHLKQWTFRNMVGTDIFKRGVPWVLLLLRNREAPSDLNLSNNSRVATFLAGVLALTVMALLLTGHAAALAPAAAFLFAGVISASFAGKSGGGRLLTLTLAALPPLAAYYLVPDPLAVIPLALILLVAWTHLAFYRYAAQRRNSAFAFAVIPQQVVFFLGCVIATMLGLIQYFFRAGHENFRTHILPLIILIFVALLAYANAWPDTLIWDDKVFALGDRLLGVSLTDIRHYFTDDVWAAVGASSGLYRPLLLVSVALDIHLFGDWVAGFHLVNIFLHVLVTLVVYGFIRYLLLVFGGELPRSSYVALLAALVFAVHPVHTEVVNSIFNRSEMLVSLGVAGGLWWFLPTVQNHPGRAWSLLGVVYLLVMLCRETGIVLPAIAVIFLWTTTAGNWRLRLRKCLPVFWLLIPLAIYLGMRANALDTPLNFEEMATRMPTGSDQGHGLPVLGLFFNPAAVLPAITVWFDSIKLMLWPNPLLTFHSQIETNQWLALAAQLALLGFAFLRLVQKKPGLFLGLAFFYLSILPSSRIIGELDTPVHLAERYLYMPSVGMSIALAFGLGWLVQKAGHKTAVVPILIALMLLTPLTWARNAQWTSNIRLAQADYNKSGQSGEILQTLVKSLLLAGDSTRAAALCDQHTDDFEDEWYLAENCAQVYASLKHFEKAEQAYMSAVLNEGNESSPHYGLAVLYLRMNRRGDAAGQFEQAIATEKQAFMKEYLAAEMMLRLYPSDLARWLEAKTHLEKAIQLQPQFYLARKKLEYINERLNSAGREPAAR